MFENMNGTNQLERIQGVMEQDYTKRHDSPYLNLMPGDLKWLVEQAEKAQHFKTALETITSESTGTLERAKKEANKVLEKGESQ